jgi:hypothetical protein
LKRNTQGLRTFFLRPPVRLGCRILTSHYAGHFKRHAVCVPNLFNLKEKIFSDFVTDFSPLKQSGFSHGERHD